MVEGGFSSPRNDTFPAGLRVLVVDDDPTWLKILEKMLKKCSYEVTTCCLARDALAKLREKKDGYDIVISDVNMPDMDGFKLLEHVGLEMDLPVIMMSVDGETSRVMKGVQHGACDYLLKPIRMKELRNIWQHVFRKRIHEVRDIESLEGMESIHLTRCGFDQLDDAHLLTGEDTYSVKKRKDAETKHDDRDFSDTASTKKARVVWSVDLHQKFVKAVDQIGFDKVGPKKILDLMNVPWLTRENVASHLQKYRMYLSRLQKENDLKKSSVGNKHSDSASKDSPGNLGLQNSITNLHKSEVSNGSHGFPVSNSLVQNVDITGHECDQKGVTSVPVEESKEVLSADIPDLRKAKKSSNMRFEPSLAPIDSGVNFSSFNSTIPTEFHWREIPDVQFKNECEPPSLENGFNHQPLPGPQHHIQAKYLQPTAPISSDSGFSITESDARSSTEIKSSYDEYRGSHANPLGPPGVVDLFPAQIKSQMLNNQVFEPISATTSGAKSLGFNLNDLNDFETAEGNLNWEYGTPLSSLDENLQFCWLQSDCYASHVGLQDTDYTDYIDPALITEVPFHLYDTFRSDNEHLLDQGLLHEVASALPLRLW